MTENDQAADGLPTGVGLTPLDPDFQQDPYATYDALRERAPVHHDPVFGRWLLTRHDDVEALLRNRDLCVDPRKAADGAFEQMFLNTLGDREPSMLFLDAPGHTRLTAPSPVLCLALARLQATPQRTYAMAMLRLRITGTEDDARAISDLLLGLDGIEHVEETDDLMPHMDDDDSSSAGLSDDIGPGIHELEVEVGNESTAQKVRDAVQELALELDVFVEYETDEG